MSGRALGDRVVQLCAILAIVSLGGVQSALANFVTFESGQVRPLALTPDGERLLAVNTPDNRLEIFDIDTDGTPPDNGITHSLSVPVGMEPVAVAVRADGSQAWVVNHLSDSISIVDLNLTPPRVVRTLLVGDEPRDIVFAGPGSNRAFITTAHRGQNTPLHSNIDTVLRQEGIGRADVWVFDATNPGSTLEGTPINIVTLFGDTPRALAVSPDGNTVYAAVFHSGNQTTAVSEGVVCNDTNPNNNTVQGPCNIAGSSYPGGLPLPERDNNGVPRPETGLIVKWNQGASQWRDQLNRNWNNAVKFSLPDEDVFAINAAGNPPAETAAFAHVGTVIFNMATGSDGTVYVSNGDARNEVRFEGDGVRGFSTVQGHLHESRITVLSGSNVLPRHLNKHITALPQGYRTNPMPQSVHDASLATPTGMVVTDTTLYVAAFGSSAIGVYDTTQLDLDTFVPELVPHIQVTGGGPSGLVLNDSGSRLYVFTRFDNSVSVIDTNANDEIQHTPVYNPEPPHVVQGRSFLYDAALTSSNGEASCSSCHIFGDLDSLAWDLGNPDEGVIPNTNPFQVPDPLGTSFADHHPMKGPMTTQSLRGMANHGPMHWRGDRSGGNSGGDPLDEDLAFKAFNVAFHGLLGRSGPLTNAQMQAFTDFILEVTYPPNPIRNLNNVLTTDQDAGRDFYFNAQPSDVFENCNGCHQLNPAQGHFGSDGDSSFENEAQLFKIPHLRNLYQKVGMFGMPAVGPFLNPGNNGDQGIQIRGFGFLHDGSVDTIFRFHNATVFNQCIPQFGCINPGGFADGAAGDPLRRQVESFMFAFDSNLAPIVGQQTTLTSTNEGTVGGRIDLLVERAGVLFPTLGLPGARECDLIVKGVVGNEERGYLYNPTTGRFQSDRIAETLDEQELRDSVDAAGESLTYTCAPPGSGTRMGIDRDEDGYFDADEVDGGSDPADPNSTPPPPPGPSCPEAPEMGCRVPGKTLLLIKNQEGDPKISWKWLKGAAALDAAAFGNPTDAAGADYSLCIYEGTGLSSVAEVPAGGSAWKATGTKGFKYKDSTLAQDGIQLIQLKAGEAGKPKVQVKGKGSGLSLPSMFPDGLTLPVTVQLRASNGECWESFFTGGAVIKNEPDYFKAKQ